MPTDRKLRDEYIIENYYAKIGSSFYTSSDFYRMRSETGGEFRPTSRFGIGILASFMVADALAVETRRIRGPHASADPIRILVEGPDSVFWLRAGSRAAPGTRTELILRSGHPWEDPGDPAFKDVVERIVASPPFPIQVRCGDDMRVNPRKSYLRRTKKAKREWCTLDAARKIHFEFDDATSGIKGAAIVAILEGEGKPVDRKNCSVAE